MTERDKGWDRELRRRIAVYDEIETRRDWRGQGFFRALTEQQEQWATAQGFDEIVVKTKNKFYDMRGTLDQLAAYLAKKA